MIDSGDWQLDFPIQNGIPSNHCQAALAASMLMCDSDPIIWNEQGVLSAMRKEYVQVFFRLSYTYPTCQPCKSG